MDAQPISSGNRCTTSGLLTATGAETVHDTTVTIAYSINGKAYTKTAITDGATPTTDAVSGDAITLTASKARVVVWCLDAAGAVKVVAGPIVDWDGVAFVKAPLFPATIPDTYCPFAYQLLKASSAAGTITFGSSNWNATGFTNSIQNVHMLPARPVTS